MRILMISQDFLPETGGIQRYTHELAREFSLHHRVRVLAPDQSGARSFDRNLPYDVVRYPVLNTSLFGATTLFAIPAAVRKFRPDVLFNAQYTTAYGSLIAKKMGLVKRYFVAAHGREMLVSHAGPISRWLRQKVLRAADGSFAVSRFTAGLVEQSGALPSRVHVVPNGVNLRHFYPRPTAELACTMGLTSAHQVIMTVCRLLPHKGIDTTINAAKRVWRSFPNMIYVVIGEGPDKERLTALAPEAVETGRLRFIGAVDYNALPVYLSLADLFVMPSRRQANGSVEGFGLAYLEAGACGTPVIAADSGGVLDAVEDGVSGLVIPPDDDVGLSHILKQLLVDDDKRRILGENGRKRAQQFTWQRAAETILDRL